MNFNHFIAGFLLVLSPMVVTANETLQPVNVESAFQNSSDSKGISLADSVINYGKLFLGTPYKYGASGAERFDCSGFTSYVYRQFGYKLERSSKDQAEKYEYVNRNDLRPGDLVFFEGRSRNGKVGHAGMVVTVYGDGNFDFIHASVNLGVTITNSMKPYYDQRYVKARRVILDETYLAKSSPPIVDPNDVPAAVQTVVIQEQHRGVKTANTAVSHIVKKGETLFSISKKYGVTVADLKKNNKLKDTALKPKQRLTIRIEDVIPEMEIPVNAQQLVAAVNDKPTSTTNQPLNASHIVKQGETLYAIAQAYGLTVEKLIHLNHLADNTIGVGQELTVSDPILLVVNESKVEPDVQPTKVHKVNAGDSLYSISKLYGCSVHDIKKWNNKKSTQLKAGEKLIIYADKTT